MAWIRRRPHATREAPSVEARDLQPALREDQAGPNGVAERSVVPMTPGNAGRGKGPQFKASARRRAGPGDWREPNNSPNGSESSGGAACQSEGFTEFSLLQSVRQVAPGGHPVSRLRRMQSQSWRGGRGRGNVLGHQGVWHGTMAGRTGEGTSGQDVSTAGGPSGMDTQAQRQTKTAGHPDDPGPRGADGCSAGARSDLRGRPAAGAVCLPARAQRVGRGTTSPPAGEPRAYGGGGRRLERVLRHDSACGIDDKRGTAHQ